MIFLFYLTNSSLLIKKVNFLICYGNLIYFKHIDCTFKYSGQNANQHFAKKCQSGRTSQSKK